MYSDDNTKTIELNMRSNDGSCLISVELPRDCTWMDIIPYFNQFLAGCGYVTSNKYNKFLEESSDADRNDCSCVCTDCK